MDLGSMYLRLVATGHDVRVFVAVHRPSGDRRRLKFGAALNLLVSELRSCESVLSPPGIDPPQMSERPLRVEAIEPSAGSRSLSHGSSTADG